MNKIIVFFILVFFCKDGWSESKKTVCLNMIVRNEVSVIKRCLQSVLPLIDSWVIVDTGSTDGTQLLINNFLKDIPGELHERPWVNFEHNRNEALDLAKSKADYLLFMDADDILSYSPAFKMPDLHQDFYVTAVRKQDEISRDLPRLVKSDCFWKWQGVVHEYLVGSKEARGGVLENVEYVCFQDGVRFKDLDTHKKDALLLERAIKEDPEDSRSLFYLSRAYQSMGKLEEALDFFNKRILMKGNQEEIYLSKLAIAQVQDRLQKPSRLVKKSFLEAYKQRPHRKESLYYLIEKLKEEGDYERGFQVASYGLKEVADHNDELFVEKFVSDTGLLLQYVLCAGKTERYKEALHACHQILERDGISCTYRARVKEYSQYLQLQSMKKWYAQIEALILEKP